MIFLPREVKLDEMPDFTGLNKIYENPNNLKPVLTKVGKGAFQMSKKSRQQYSKILKRRKQKIERRLKRKQWEDQERPMFNGRNIHYEVAEKSQAINCGV